MLFFTAMPRPTPKALSGAMKTSNCTNLTIVPVMLASGLLPTCKLWSNNAYANPPNSMARGE